MKRLLFALCTIMLISPSISFGMKLEDVQTDKQKEEYIQDILFQKIDLNYLKDILSLKEKDPSFFNACARKIALYHPEDILRFYHQSKELQEKFKNTPLSIHFIFDNIQHLSSIKNHLPLYLYILIKT